MIEIVELRSEAELRDAFIVMHELRPKLDQKQYLELLTEMLPSGYHLFALRDSGRIIALAGVAVLTNLYYRRYVWIYDLVTRRSERSKGYGKKLLEYVEEFARREGCNVVALSSGLERKEAHRFYEERMGYDKSSYVFKKVLC